MPIEADITAVVGSNESGKSQLLAAVKAALGGKPIDRSDFCRYSELYSVRTNEIRLPEFGATFHIDDTEAQWLQELIGVPNIKEFALFRPGADRPFVVVNSSKHEITPEELATIEQRLPSFEVLRTDLAIPDSVSIDELAGLPRTAIHSRKRRFGIFETLAALDSSADPATTGTAIMAALAMGNDEATTEAEAKRKAEFNLARQLLIDAAGIAPESFGELRTAVESGREGHVEAVIGAMNSAINENLNIQRWWSQDRDFDLLVEPRERELAFVIQDRTTAKYSFGERSQGLRFFLSYFVQLVSHRLNKAKPDILLLDEPDAYLSSVGQNDLLRLLQDYAVPEDESLRSQVIYVTHSPFLIDKNAPHRIRVLDKGSEDEGTRVVRDAANNRYEPLRSSIGGHLAETAFIGGANLFVEGQADQILLAGLSAHMTRRNGSTAGLLDLNEITIVAAGGADSIPYMVYLARGRDTVKPPCVALLDGDQSGKDAEKILKRGEARRRRVLRDEYIIRLDTWAAAANELDIDSGVTVEEIEDLIPLSVLHRAALNYLGRFADLATVDSAAFSVDAIRKALVTNSGSVWGAIDSTFRSTFVDEHLEKVGLAREVVSLINLQPDCEGADVLRTRIAALIGHLSERLDDAASEEERDRSDDRLKRSVKNFERNHTLGMRKQVAMKLLREIETASRTSPFSNDIRDKLDNIAKDYELTDLSVPNVPRFDEFRVAVKGLAMSERLAYQDDAATDPAASVLPATPKRAKVRRTGAEAAS
ncbi:TOPRIM nucleotidyl transferase/hydrolase domain-containing protein [Mycolicibacterium porcinum]|uniref:TOPRIM nucleotidyl transferase/hydrolase domain-containing protein n=1 Tax=Mycolicibacterium porcinum TaxID=39693 RepID=UPI001645857B|nr:TOPRIM nucleotidyl transferase/hydrolase domain-containing protein [Mycolicibacterium porcinum]